MYSAPSHTSINRQEFKPDKYVIAFAPELVGFILTGQKLTTYRFGKKYDYLQIGDIVGIQDSDTKEISTKAKIIAKSETTFKDLPIKTGAHESYQDKNHQRQVLSGYYAYTGREVRDDDPFLIFEFELLTPGF